jgi:23S rRNA (cytosine1962-C5)-methyltransferase
MGIQGIFFRIDPHQLMKNSRTKPASATDPACLHDWPVILESDDWADYRLLDSGDGQKLERFGQMVVARPEEQAIWAPRLPKSRWNTAHATFSGDPEEDGPGRWKFSATQPETWPMAFGDIRFLGRFTSFRHVGVFPEQTAHWTWLSDRIARAPGTPRVLNLFGYTGIASLMAAAAGARVTHVDASKKAIGWARENQHLSKLSDRPIRWICDDAIKFTAREVRRGNTYDAIILDPPKYGRGPKGETWHLFDDLPKILDLCRTLMSDTPLFAILTAYAIRSSSVSLNQLMGERFDDLGGRLEAGELVLRERIEDRRGGRLLSTSLFSRWSRP